MKTRIITSAVGLAMLAVVLFFYETIFFNLIFALVCLVAIAEVFVAFKFKKRDIYIYLAFAAMAVLVMYSSYKFIFSLLKPVAYVFVLFLAFCVVFNYKRVSFANIAGFSVFSAIVVFCFYSIIYLKQLLPQGQFGYDTVYFVLLILAYAWGGDTFAYFVGRKWGRRKLAPNISPKKTVEGAVGGIIGSMLLGLVVTVVYTLIARRLLGVESVSALYYIIVAVMGIVASILGIMGDLFASAVKRQCGIKDFGTIFPGHGGILDRFDSVLFIAPLVSMVVRVLFYSVG